MKRSLESRILAVLFFGPPVLVAVAVLGPWELDWLPQAETPYGQRYDPPIPLPATPLVTPDGDRTSPEWARARWSLIYARASACDDRCVQRLETLRQVTLGLSRDREFVQRVYLYGGDMGALGAERALRADLVIGRIDGQAAADLRSALGQDDLSDGHIYIADPRGNLVYSYPLDAEREGILRDLERLLAIYRAV